MPNTDFSVAFYQLSIDFLVNWVTQHRWNQSLGKTEATKETIKGLLEAKFIFKMKYIMWLANVVIVRKVKIKCRMW